MRRPGYARTAAPAKRTSAIPRKWLMAALAVLLLIGLVETFRFYRAYSNLTSAKEDMTVAADLLRGKGLDITDTDLAAADARFDRAEPKLSSANSTFSNDPLLAVAGTLPWLSKQIDAAKRLTQIGEDSAEMGKSATAVITHYRAVRQGSPNTPIGERAADLLNAIDGDMTSLKSGLASVDAERQGIKGGLVGPLASATDTLDSNLGYLRSQVALYDQASVIVPEILGFSGPRSFLLLAQDNTELFPTGGLISVYGVISVDKGRLTSMRFSNVNLLGAEKLRNGEYVEPPGPLQRYLVHDWSWNLGTANWSPDFPTSAKQAQVFLGKAGEGPVDGVIAINFLVLEELLRVLGPVALPEYGVTVTADNATETILEQSHNARGLAEGRHVFPSKVADRILNGVLAAPGEKWSGILDALNKMGKQSQIFLYSNRPEVETKIMGLGWDGGLLEARGSDYLMLVDTSILSTKLNLIMNEKLKLSTRVDEAGNVTHKVQVDYQNPYPEWAKGKSAVLQSQMLGGLYGDYLRLYAPQGAVLSEVRQDGQTTSIEDNGMELSKSWFGSFLRVPAGASTSISYVYTSPIRVQASDDLWEYTMVVQKQSGVEGLPLHVDIYIPAGATNITTSVNGKLMPHLSFDTELREDQNIKVQYRLESVQ